MRYIQPYSTFSINESINILLAPNGNKSNLSNELYTYVRTDEFKQFFGDWENDTINSSKVLDENGEPLLVMHGTNTDFEEFSNKFTGKKWGIGAFGKGFYFTNNPSTAGYYGSKFRKYCFLNIRKPYLIDEQFSTDYGEIPKQYPKIHYSDKIPDLSKRLKQRKFDGVIGEDTLFGDGDMEYVVFNNTQIKSIKL